MFLNDVTCVVCVKNEEDRIADCLESIKLNNPFEIIVVDGDSSDGTVEVASEYTDNIIVSKKSNLTRDRQIGVDSVSTDFIAMIDADHRLEADSLQRLLFDMSEGNYDIVQSQLISYKNNNYWNMA
jgi:glycosyltransferase involved in cell wall biosynthesis